MKIIFYLKQINKENYSQRVLINKYVCSYFQSNNKNRACLNARYWNVILKPTTSIKKERHHETNMPVKSININCSNKINPGK